MTGDGWCPFAERVEMVPERYALNVGVPAGEMVPQVIVDHVMGGWYSYALEMMRDPTVGDDPDDYASWHFSIAKDGRVAQHASIFTPCMGAGLKSSSVTPEPITAFRKRWHYNPNAWTVHIEHEDGGVRNPTLTEEQIKASIAVHRWVWQQCEWLRSLPRGFWWNPDTADSRIVYHSEIDPPNRADDPGANFPWSRIVEETLIPPLPFASEKDRGRREMYDALLARKRAEVEQAIQQLAEWEALESDWYIPKVGG